MHENIDVFQDVRVTRWARRWQILKPFVYKIKHSIDMKFALMVLMPIRCKLSCFLGPVVSMRKILLYVTVEVLSIKYLYVFQLKLFKNCKLKIRATFWRQTETIGNIQWSASWVEKCSSVACLYSDPLKIETCVYVSTAMFLFYSLLWFYL